METRGTNEFEQVHPVEQLRARMADVAPFPTGVMAIPSPVGVTSFFPGGSGLWNTSAGKPTPPMPIGGIMVLGHDYDSKSGYEKTMKDDGKNLRGPTWKHLRNFLEMAGLSPSNCFFTNFFMGLRADGSATGPFPGRHDADFVQRCRDFLRVQLSIQRPKVVLVLGQQVPSLIADMCEGLRPWRGCKTFSQIDEGDRGVLSNVRFADLPSVLPMAFVALVHPSYRTLNVRKRRYKTENKDQAELLMVQDAMSQ